MTDKLIENPFNISFGKPPENPIERYSDLNEIYASFDNTNPESNIYIITGPRGFGKTVCLTMVGDYYKQKEEWIVININPNIDICEQLVGKIYETGKVKKLFIKSEFNFSFASASISLKGDNPISNISTMLDKIFEHLKKKHIKVLILIDEVSTNNYIKIFAQTFQILLRENYDIYTVMTGLYQNISDLQNQDNLTFLYRAPKIYLSPLNLRAISLSYSEIFNLNINESLILARTTMGYAFAYQLLGYILYKEGTTTINEKILNRYDLLLDERVYSKIYSELTRKEKEILKFLANNEINNNKKIIDELGLSKGTLSTYKERLAKKGIINTQERGIIKFSLPRFKEFLHFKSIVEE